MRIALRNSPRVAAIRGDVAAARQGTRAAAALTNPTAAFTPALTGGVSGGSDNELLLQQPLELNGTRTARKNAAAARQKGAEAQSVVELRTLVFEIRTAYYELVRAQEQAAVARDLRKTAEELDTATHKQVEAGARPAIDQTQTSIEVIRAGQQVTLADANITSRAAVLNALMARPADSPLTVTGFEKTPAAPKPLPSLTEAEAQAVANRAELTAGGAAAEAFRQEARLAQAEGKPDLAPQYRATSITHGIQQSGFGIGITLPFLDYGSRRNRVRQAEESAHAEEERLNALRLQVRQEVAQALAQSRAAEAILDSYTRAGASILEQSRSLLEASRLGYQEGKTSIVQLVEAQRTYRQTSNDFINAQVAAALARAELERAMGTFPAPAISSSKSFMSLPSVVSPAGRTP